ncbi:helicase-exonuclease AddAB subunit AddB [Clostridium colicanis]|uniref:ATP-dependent helicase/deoxyribonuclease subunit B n=1 Tax=Clostridium colicanis DSM 13634 TaxID=1121305 RepID=A0A151AL92_9CLOT|nr:helicase-exonuclease AddAB subunit AddB [Clostridium colicanis]KYH28414.1 ATP-dependent helicase/deoxyribonuclease subunit B [Clostridium colicanis DSM 13634]
MSLRFIYGRAGTGKSRYCVDAIEKNLKEGEKGPLILIVPEQFSFQAEKSVVEKVKGTGIVNVEVTSFKRMAYSVFNEVGGATRKFINSSGRLMLIFNIINKLKEELIIFKTAADQQGFVNTIGDVITELKRYDITPQELKSSISLMEEDEFLKEKILDISNIFEKFEENLHKNKEYLDSEDELALLYSKLDKSTMFDNGEVWIDEFSSFTPQQYNIIEKLLKKTKRVNITLCMDHSMEIQNGDVFAPIKNTRDKLLELARENNIPVENDVILKHNKEDRFKDSKEMRYVEANYFKYPYKQYKGKTEDLKIIRALNPYSEIEKVAREIVEMVRSKGLRFRDIAVISRDLQAYEKIVKTIFTEYEIPYFIDKKREIYDNPLIVLITSAIDIFNRNWSYETVFRYLKTGLINIPKEDIDILENYVMAYGIRGKNKWSSMWKYGSEENLEKINDVRLKVVIPLINFYSNLKGKKSAEEICTALYNFLCSIGANETVESWVNRFKEEGNQDLAREYSQIWNMVIELLDQVVEVFRGEKIELKEFVKILSLGFGEYKMGLIPPSLDQVLVSDVERVRTHDIKLLYIVGVNDGVFPAVEKDEGILSDADRDKLKKIGIEIAESTKSKTFEEQYLIYRTLTTTGKYLRICYPIADFEGKALRSSIIVSRFNSLFPNIQIESDSLEIEDEGENLELVSRKIPTFNKLISILRKDQKNIRVSPFWTDVYRWYSDEKNGFKYRLKTVFSAAAFTNSVENISQEKARKIYGDRLYLSVSRIEKYVSCPFAYYIQYGLKAKERKTFALTPPDLGTFMHNVIDEFSAVVDKNSLEWYEIDEKWCKDKVSEIVDKKAEEVSGGIFSSSPRYRYFTERLKRVLVKTILIIVEHLKRSGFQPIGHEIGFGSGESYPPIEIELSSGEKVRLIGRIDRVDKLDLEKKDYFRVIDYKSGNKDFSLSDVYYGLQLQLLTYLDAILTNEELRGEDQVLPGGVLYLKIDDPIIRGSRNLSDKEIEEEIMKALKMKGLLIADPEIVKEMDRQIDGSSLIIPARINNDGTLGKSSSVGTEEQFKMLREHVKKKLVESCESMLRGEIRINPIKSKNLDACTYCVYSAICQFDSSFEGNGYRTIKDESDEEIWKRLEKEKQEKLDES